MKKPIRILHVLATLDMGGIENFLMNIYRNIDRNKIQFDFVINDRGKEDIFEKEIEKFGGRIFKIPSISNEGHFKYFKNLKNIFQKNKYDIVHSHYNAISGFILKEAKKVGVKNRIAHSHIAYPKYSFLAKIYKEYSRKLILKNSTKNLACSTKAGKWLFKSEDFELINNAIDTKKFKFNNKIRINKREELEIKNDEIVIGHVGRFQYSKNHGLLIDIFHEMVKKNNKCKLVLVGDGELKEKIERKIKLLGLEGKVLLLGVREDIAEIYQLFDIFVFPSFYEGLPLAVIEAQIAGLKCFISDRISNEVDLGYELIKFIDIDESCEEIVKKIDLENIYSRELKIEAIDYDIGYTVKKIERMYLNLKK